ncbi:hypothetical protein COL940_012234 [Colletotrichum noveboracense]|nr:hypothetical protein COL940_012234 [Colletotrichum noveboracense]KAJ0275024.1 hypothetical protein CBS470a_011482 [Colletotrichum nupharicola]
MKCPTFYRDVTVSLFQGLRHIRRTDCAGIAWADAINQFNDAEKAHQVDLMGVIYDQAAEVVVWLGHDSECFAETAFDDVVLAHSVVKKGTQHKWSVVPDAIFMSASIRNHLSEETESPYPVTHFKSVLPSILDVRHTDSIKRLYQLTWFTRVWALQEVGLATKATAYWGDHCFEFSEINVLIHFATTDEDLVKIRKLKTSYSARRTAPSGTYAGPRGVEAG